MDRPRTSPIWQAWIEIAALAALAIAARVVADLGLAWLALAPGEHPRSAPLALLVARIELRCGSPAEAEAALARAVKLGLPPAIAAPYLAEVAFAQRRFDRVRQRLAAAPGGSAAVDRIRRFWS